MANKNQFIGRDAFYRMQHLYQIADMCRGNPGDEYRKLMLYYGSQLVSIGKKTQNRMHPSMKRTICKGCNCILRLGDTEKCKLVKVKGQPHRLVCVCSVCASEKAFPLRSGYRLACERPESIVQVIDTASQQSSKDKKSLKDTNQAARNTNHEKERSDLLSLINAVNCKKDEFNK